MAISDDALLALYRTMCRIRAFEDAAEEASRGGVAAFGQAGTGNAAVRGPLHLSTGQEAVAAGVCAHLRPTDYLTSTHRGHGHTLAKGADLARMMHELFGKASGYCGGKGGSMHIADFSVGMLGANGVVAAGIPIAVGAAQSIRLRGIDAIAVSFFGDGAINRGPFAESLNWAAAFALPVLFVCEDNAWSATTKTDAMSAGEGAAARARAFGVPSAVVDGNDAEAVFSAAGEAIAAVRSGTGPRLLHAKTYRFKGHVSVDPAAYRDPDELRQAMAGDPLQRTRGRLIERGIDAAAIDALMNAARIEVAAAIESASQAPWPAAEVAAADVQTTGEGRWFS
ncbi:MAG TPA: thiamine pyrophosphate-dependent dehydrogenase E1 component subunit alpha [Burkholderiaceae bacterium]|nr:thiamine pyrophosphate-dependent dehydrogenase E1 component subunit alpha [Burkholderiaceae bacterium]